MPNSASLVTSLRTVSAKLQNGFAYANANLGPQVCLDYRPVNTKTVEPDNPPVPPAKRVY